ncbi:MAG: class I SAM-dependent methyltransferase [Methanophagales archaeon]|nr:class I SAM-dependent methyltransferase [Methanophagales archaeon]
MGILANEVELVSELCERIKRETDKSKLPTAVKILDIGCGTGKLAIHLGSETAYDVTGIDPVRVNVEKAQIKAATSMVTAAFAVQSAEAIAFADSSFDFVVSLKALHEFHNLGKALKESMRVLKEGGKIFIIDWIGSVAGTRSHLHVKKYYSPERLKESIVDAGFTNLSLKINKTSKLMLCEGKKLQ